MIDLYVSEKKKFGNGNGSAKITVRVQQILNRALNPKPKSQTPNPKPKPQTPNPNLKRRKGGKKMPKWGEKWEGKPARDAETKR